MKYRKLGRTNIQVSEIGLGCSGFWGDKFFSEAKAQAVIHGAIDQGINFFDTGSNYSNFNAEPRLGRALAPLIKSGNRDKVIISTKAGSTVGYAPSVPDDDLASGDQSPEFIVKSCYDSMKNLGLDYIDIFQLHGLKHETFNNALFDCLLGLKEKGVIRAIGVNTHFKAEMYKVAEKSDVFDMVLIDCNLLQLDRFETIKDITSMGLGVVVGTVLAQGHLVSRKIGSLRNGSFFWYLARSLIKPTTKDFQRGSASMRSVLSEIPEMTAAQAAFVYLLENTDICSCLFGTTELKNMMEIVAAVDMVLSDESKRRIEEAFSSSTSLSR